MKKIISVILIFTLVFTAASLSASADEKYTYGDVNGDGGINSADALMIMQYSVGLVRLDSNQKIIADVSSDGIINSSDALSVLMFATGLIESLGKLYENSLKHKYVDPVFSGSAYTVAYTAELDGQAVDIVATQSGSKQGASMTMRLDLTDISEIADEEDAADLALLKAFFGNEIELEIRYFRDSAGRFYIIIPLLKCYAETSGDFVGELFSSVRTIFKEEYPLNGTSSEKKDGVNLICESFDVSGEPLKYYFSGSSLKYVSVPSETDGVYKINKLSSSAENYLLSIPSGYREDNSISDFGG